MSARLAKLAAQTRNPEPYPVTDTLIVAAPTRPRVKAMGDAESEIYLLTGLLSQATARVTTPKPTKPTLAADATDEQQAAFAAEFAAWEHQVADWEHLVAETSGAITAIRAKLDAAKDAYEAAFFGDAYAEVTAYFEDKPALWDKFSADIRKEFLPPAPDDGICPTCGHTDEEQAGKAPSSST